jgi:hypothetical protein
MDYEELVKKEPYNVNLWKEYAQHYYGKHERFFTERLRMYSVFLLLRLQLLSNRTRAAYCISSS